MSQYYECPDYTSNYIRHPTEDNGLTNPLALPAPSAAQHTALSVKCGGRYWQDGAELGLVWHASPKGKNSLSVGGHMRLMYIYGLATASGEGGNSDPTSLTKQNMWLGAAPSVRGSYSRTLRTIGRLSIGAEANLQVGAAWGGVLGGAPQPTGLGSWMVFYGGNVGLYMDFGGRKRETPQPVAVGGSDEAL